MCQPIFMTQLRLRLRGLILLTFADVRICQKMLDGFDELINLAACTESILRACIAGPWLGRDLGLFR